VKITKRCPQFKAKVNHMLVVGVKSGECGLRGSQRFSLKITQTIIIEGNVTQQHDRVTNIKIKIQAIRTKVHLR